MEPDQHDELLLQAAWPSLQVADWISVDNNSKGRRPSTQLVNIKLVQTAPAQLTGKLDLLMCGLTDPNPHPQPHLCVSPHLTSFSPTPTPNSAPPGCPKKPIVIIKSQQQGCVYCISYREKLTKRYRPWSLMPVAHLSRT